MTPMPYWLATKMDQQSTAYVKRFDPRFWTVNFPRPMMAGVTTTGANGLRADCVFYRTDDLAGLIWEAEDVWDHPLLAYQTSRDFRGCRFSFHWRANGMMPLDAINGPTLTIEGRDAAGQPKSWYVRLWNYAAGLPNDAIITLDFDALEGGFALPVNADPIWAGDIDRMFISLVPPAFNTGPGAALPSPVEAWVEMTDISCTGAGSVLNMGDTLVPPHGLSIATGYDDCYNLTPERVLRNAFHLGYRGSINHYVGMSHYFRLDPVAGGFYVSLTGGALNAPCAAWHADFAVRAKAYGYSLITSLSYELFDAHTWNDWKQRTYVGAPALTGWVPPSTLLSPANASANIYLQSVARAFVQIAVTAGHAPRFQIGEPWWWITSDGRPCLYDDAAKAAFGGNPVNIANVRSTNLSANKKALLDAAGVILATSTLALANAVKADHPTCETLLLVYLPTVLDEAAPDLKRANVPLGWASPAFDVLQLEDYDWVTTGNVGASVRGVAEAQTRLGYPVQDQHYFSGFVLKPEERGQWALIDDAAHVARKRGVAETFIWALPQVARDGYTHFNLETNESEAAMQAFDDVLFPLALGREAQVSPGFSTAIVTTASGREYRNANWASGRMRYDVGTGVRSESDLQTLINFFRARRGAAKAFRFHDPLDNSSKSMTKNPSAMDQILGDGDGVRTSFPLIKRYGDGEEAEVRRITRPIVESVQVAIDGTVQTSGWTLVDGVVTFTVAPPVDSVVTAGFLFDVPVRFAEDTLDIDTTTFLAGVVPQVPLIEVR
jgi:uncharacterized protein (TIGR02217 family)